MKPAEISRRDFVATSTGLAATFSVLDVVAATAAPATQRRGNQAEIKDENGALGRTRAPICAKIALPARLRGLAAQGRLVARELTPGAAKDVCTPVQPLLDPTNDEELLCWRLPAGIPGGRLFSLEATTQPRATIFAAEKNGQFEIAEGLKPVLRYNYSKIQPGNLLKSISEANLKYAVGRSDYIHPLYGPEGEILTKDWSVDHPHHRGIYWAWPEVDWDGQRGDLHALQKVFACPTGRCEAISGPVFAELLAENLWRWEDGQDVVRENARIRAYVADDNGHIIDLEFEFEALKDPVAIARRDTSHYGGLNIRLAAVKGQQITKHTGLAAPKPQMAWSDLSGTFAGASTAAGITIVQHMSNPDYPGDWIEYPELNWLQPTFPRSGTRYTIEKGKGLKLRFRLWIHRGTLVPESVGADLWTAANSKASPLTGNGR